MAHLDSLPDIPVLKIENLDIEQIPEGILIFSPDEKHFLPTEDNIESLKANAQNVQDLLKELSLQGIDVKYIIQSYKLLTDNYCTSQGKRLIPTIDGKKHIITMYDRIKLYREKVFSISEHGPFPTKDDYHLLIILRIYFWLYDEYCSSIRDVIAPPISQPATETSPVTLPVPSNDEKVNPVKGNDEKNEETSKNLEELANYFKAKFRGFGGGHDYFSDLVKDALNLSTDKELGMVAYLIYQSNQLNIRRPKTFSSWIRTFFKLLGKTPPQDTHLNKYKPNEIISGIFAYIK